MKIRLFMVAAMLGLLAAACTKDQQQDNTTVKTPISIKANYGNNGSKVNYTESGSTISATWQSGDKLLVIYNNNVNTLDLVDGAGDNSATFSGDITGTPADGAMLVCYVKDQNTPSGTITVNGDGSHIYTSDAFLGQDGTLAGASKLNLYCGWTRYSSSSDISCTFGVNTSMMKFTVSGISADAGRAATITYKSGNTDIAKATFTVAVGDNLIYLTIPAGHYTGEQSLVYTCGGTELSNSLSNTQANFTAGQTYSKEIEFFDARNYPLTFEAIQDGAAVAFRSAGGDNVNSVNLEYSLNDGAWTSYTGNLIWLNAGEKVAFRGTNSTINTSSARPLSSNSYNYFSGGYCYVYGNIMSILSASDFATATTLSSEYTFARLFSGVNSHPSKELVLPATNLTRGCYQNMFEDCTSLSRAPKLPATSLADSCYFQMFANCQSLKTPPTLPATILSNSCYEGMFINSGLLSAPILPATTLAERCYSLMFQNCRSLTSTPATLPATTLANYCYLSMFLGCASLTTAPSLPATTLANYCYQNMFYGCTNLNNVKCLATDISAPYCTSSWLGGVSATGTFTKATSMSSWTSGANGIPSGWTVNNQ